MALEQGSEQYWGRKVTKTETQRIEDLEFDVIQLKEGYGILASGLEEIKRQLEYFPKKMEGSIYSKTEEIVRLLRGENTTPIFPGGCSSPNISTTPSGTQTINKPCSDSSLMTPPGFRALDPQAVLERVDSLETQTNELNFMGGSKDEKFLVMEAAEDIDTQVFDKMPERETKEVFEVSKLEGGLLIENCPKVTGTKKSDKGIDDLIKSLINCYSFDGDWVRDYSYPLCKPNSCSLIDEQFNCLLNGRPDNGYLKHKWKQKGYTLQRLNESHTLKILRGKRLVFIDYSLNTNMWESLICILRNFVKYQQKTYKESGRHHFRGEACYSLVFEDYKCKVEFFMSPLVVQEWEVNGKLGTRKETFSLDFIGWLTAKYKDADIIVVNIEHWWTHDKTSKEKDYYLEDSHVCNEFMIDPDGLLIVWLREMQHSRQVELQLAYAGPGGFNVISEMVRVETMAQCGVIFLLFTLGLKFSTTKLRDGHTIGFGKNLFAFGGFLDEQNLYDDIYMLDMENDTWTKIIAIGDGPSGRFSITGDSLDPQMGGVLLISISSHDDHLTSV